MKHKTIYLIRSFTLIVYFSLLLSGCTKEDKSAGINDPIPTTGVIFNPDLVYGTVTDIDGNVYKTIEIASRVWLAENLKTTRYRNGDQIPNVKDDDEWYNLTSGAYCNYDNSIYNAKTYGRLYNYYAVIDYRKIAPRGWHVATSEEWIDLTDYIQMSSSVLKETGSAHWIGSSLYVTNNTGFTALPGGGRLISWGTSEFKLKGEVSFWWSTPNAGCQELWGSTGFSRSPANEKRGFSIRCVKD